MFKIFLILATLVASSVQADPPVFIYADPAPVVVDYWQQEEQRAYQAQIIELQEEANYYRQQEEYRRREEEFRRQAEWMRGR